MKPRKQIQAELLEIKRKISTMNRALVRQVSALEDIKRKAGQAAMKAEADRNRVVTRFDQAIIKLMRREAILEGRLS
jgi:hypothetical protein